MREGVTASHARRNRRAGVGLMVLGLALLSASSAIAAPGDLDPTFSRDGKRVDRFIGEFEAARDVALSGNRIVVVGTSERPGNSVAVLASYRRNGRLDDSFGDGGHVTMSAGALTEANAVVVGADGRIVVAGVTRALGGTPDVLLARFNPDGSLDPAFGSGGIVTTDFGEPTGDQARDLAVQSDERIIVAGKVNGRPALIRYLPNGLLDTSYAGDGATEPPVPDMTVYEALAMLPNGSAVAVGESHGALLARYLPDGAPDPSFSEDGLAITPPPSPSCLIAQDVTITAGEGILASGSFGCPGFPSREATLSSYRSDGSLDPTFSQDGFLFVPGETFAEDTALAMQANGRPLIATSDHPYLFPKDQDFVVARFTQSGKPDRSFSGNGRLTTDFSEEQDFAQAAILQGDRLIVVGGTIRSPNQSDFAIARYSLAR